MVRVTPFEPQPVGAAAPSSTAERRGRDLLDALRHVVAYEAAWLGLVDPLTQECRCLARVDMAEAAPRLAEEPGGVDDGADALVVTRLVLAGRAVGLLVLRLAVPDVARGRAVDRLEGLAPVMAHDIDPLRSVLAVAHLVPHITAGALLVADGRCVGLPGLTPDALLDRASPVVTTARRQIEEGALSSTFLWPRGDARAPSGHVSITVVAAPAGAPAGSTAVATTAAAPDLQGLTARELSVLGHLVEGCSNHEIARTLGIAPRTVAAHLEHILCKLDAPTRTLAAVRAQQRGLYVPVPS